MIIRKILKKGVELRDEIKYKLKLKYLQDKSINTMIFNENDLYFYTYNLLVCPKR